MSDFVTHYETQLKRLTSIMYHLEDIVFMQADPNTTTHCILNK